METLTKDQKYFKKRAMHFFNSYLETDEPDNETVNILYKYQEYLRSQHYERTFDRSSTLAIAQQTTRAGFDTASFADGVDAMAAHVQSAFIALQNENVQLKKQLNEQKRKHKNMRNGLMGRIKELEAIDKVAPNIVQLAHMAYQAGQRSINLVAYKGLNPEANEYYTIKKTMNFYTWANQIWKYGKGLRITKAVRQLQRKVILPPTQSGSARLNDYDEDESEERAVPSTPRFVTGRIQRN